MEIRTPAELAAQWQRTPCVMRGLLPAEALRRWHPDALRRSCGGAPLLVRSYSPDHHHGMTPWSEDAQSLGAFLDDDSAGRKRQVVRHFAAEQEPGPLGEALRPAAASMRRWCEAALGSEAAARIKEGVLRISKLPWTFGAHYDCRPALVAQLHGERTFELQPYASGDYPDLHGAERLPAAAYRLTLRPGDVLHLPTLYSHAVTAPGAPPDVSILCSLFVDDSTDDYVCEARFRRDFAQRTRDLRQRDHLRR